MRPAPYYRKPWGGVGILAAGAIAYWALCLPALLCRPPSNLQPGVLILRWLWPVPLVLSAWFDRSSRLRWWAIVAYAFVTAPAVGTPPSFARPEILPMLGMGAIAFPFILAIGVLVELGAQGILGLFSSAEDKPESDRSAPARGVKARTVTFVGVLLTGSAAFPLIYNARVLAEARDKGCRQAEKDWQNGTAILYVQSAECYPDLVEMHATGARPSRWAWDPKTGLRVTETNGGAVGRASVEAYRNVIKEKLAKYGPTPTARYLFNGDEMKRLLESGRLEEVRRETVQYGKVTVSKRRNVWSAGSHRFIGERTSISAGVVPEKGDALVVAGEWEVVTFDSEGQLLQVFRYERLGMKPGEVVPGLPGDRNSEH